MSLDELLVLLAAMATVPSEETAGLSELDHGLQCAAELARGRPEDRGLQVAGLVHDIGHEHGSEEAHGWLGAARVRGLLGERVAGLVEAHVPAKRYLVTVDDAYRRQLSPESRRNLALQGETLSPAELSAFTSSPFAKDAVTLRRADDAAKVPGRPVAPLETWEPVLRAWVGDESGRAR